MITWRIGSSNINSSTWMTDVREIMDKQKQNGIVVSGTYAKIILTLLVTWGAWITMETLDNSHFRKRGDRFTTVDWERGRAAINEKINDTLWSVETELKVIRSEIQQMRNESARRSGETYE